MFTAEQIESIGGKRWTNARRNKIRVYVNNWAELINFEVSYYNIGNICGAEINGNRISNNEARRILASEPAVWWENGSIHTTDGTPLANYLDTITAAIRAKLTPAPSLPPLPPLPPAAAPGTGQLPEGVIELEMPRGPAGRHRVHLGSLTPKARALAEAIAQTDWRWIRTRSVQPRRELYAPGHAELMWGSGSAVLDQPEDGKFEGWMVNPTPSGYSIGHILEWEARKLTGCYPIGDDGHDLPSSQAARLDDGLTPDQVMALLRNLNESHSVATGRRVPVPGKDMWMRKATRGVDGYPAPVCHNGITSLWSAAAVRNFFNQLVSAGPAGAR